ncbi:glycoside hydrolase family 43 protein [Marasmius fiardii PR-910]|nr:glycoside hydrolase family 43 protein [Marasmius fiardii PR-910]
MHFLFLLASLFSVIASVFAVPNPLPGSENIIVRDPTIWYNPDSRKYFVFSTGGGIKIFTSPSLTGPWTNVGFVLPDCSKIDLPGRCEIWAPSISFNLGKYVLYYSVSQVNSQDAAIGVATSPSMEPGTWTDLGEVVRSKGGDSFIAIDPDLINDNGLKLSFGSHVQGIFQISIGPDVNNPASPTPGTHLAGGKNRGVEGGTTFKPDNSSFWFHFFSDGVTLFGNGRPPAGGEYKVRVGRGTSGMGPFVGQLGHALTEQRDPPTGTVILASHDDVYAPGGQSIFKDPISGRYVIVYHYVRNSANDDSKAFLGINFLDFSSGWPVVVA